MRGRGVRLLCKAVLFYPGVGNKPPPLRAGPSGILGGGGGQNCVNPKSEFG